MKMIIQYVAFCLMFSVLVALPTIFGFHNPFIEGDAWGYTIAHYLGVVLYWGVIPLGIYREIKKHFFTVSVAAKPLQSSMSDKPEMTYQEPKFSSDRWAQIAEVERLVI